MQRLARGSLVTTKTNAADGQTNSSPGGYYQPVVSANLISRVYLHENVSNTVQQQWTKLM
jgi:hypothetical protein